MRKAAVFAFLTLLVLVSFARAARPEPASPKTIQPAQELNDDQVIDTADDAEESCEGASEEECLMRRTLVAHIDYIYTQGGKKH